MDIKDKLRLTQNVVFVTGIFCIVIALLLLLNFWQVSKNEPLESKAMEVLVERLSQEPQNEELKQEIRNLDLLARKAYFNSQWQIEAGAYLLLFGAILFAIALRIFYSLKAKIEEPDTLVENENIARLLSQKWIVIVGAGILVVALVSSYFTVDYLNSYTLDTSKTAVIAEENDEQIEIVEVASVPERKQEVNDIQIESTDSKTDEEVTDKEISEPTNEATVESKTEEVKKESVPVKASDIYPGIELIKANHNSFRGPMGNGVSFSRNIPTDWDANGKNLLWKEKIPKPGYNSPVIWGDKIFLAGGDAQSREVYCFDKNSGKILWTKPADNIQGSPTKMPKVTEDTGLSASTVSTDGQRVFAIFATGDIICFDTNGNRLWAKNLGVPDNHYGHSSSLICWKDKVFIQYDTNKGGKVLALNSQTGETVWETVRKSKISWASPILAEVNGKMQLVLSADPIVAGYDTDSGKELWAVECMMGEVGPSPAFGSGLIFAGNEYATLAAIDPVSGTIKWKDDEYLPEVASPVAANGLLIVATSYGVLVCYDAISGKKLWEEEYSSGFYASPVIADNKIFALDTEGIMHILELSREAKVIATPNLGEEGYTTPAFSDGRIYIRGKENLYCFGK